MRDSARFVVVVVCVAAVAIGGASFARAGIIAYDHLSGYTPGLLRDQGQGSGWADNWLNPESTFTVDPSSDLTYPGVTGAMGRANSGTLLYPGSGVNRTMNTAVNSGTVYFGALLALGDTGGAIRMIYLGSDGTGTNGSVMIGQYNGVYPGSNSLTWYLTLRPFDTGYSGQQAVNTGIAVTTATTYLVAKIDFDTNGTLDTVRLFVNPTSAQELDLNVGVDAMMNTMNVGTLNRFGAYINDDSYFLLDEVRVGTTGADMFGPITTGGIPEPASMVLLALGAGLAALRRRRRN